MLIIIDKRIPEEAKKSLGDFGKIVEFETQNITYSAISGHPDIFLNKTHNTLICAPNLPEKYFNLFTQEGINYILGKNRVGDKYPETSFYNCVVNERYIVHKKSFTDERILERNKHLDFINVPQAYTRCSLIALSANNFITSDKGIEKALINRKLTVNYFPPDEIVLPMMPHGFIGGAMGLHLGKLFVIGNPHFHSWGKAFKSIIAKQDIEIISLYEGALFDGGGIFFLE